MKLYIYLFIFLFEISFFNLSSNSFHMFYHSNLFNYQQIHQIILFSILLLSLFCINIFIYTYFITFSLLYIAPFIQQLLYNYSKNNTSINGKITNP